MIILLQIVFLLQGATPKTAPMDDKTIFAVIVTAVITGIFGVIAAVIAYYAGKPKTAMDIKKSTHEMLHNTQEDMAVWVKRFTEIAERAYDLEDDYEEVNRVHKNLVYDVTDFFYHVELLIEEAPDIMKTPSYGRMVKAIARMRARYNFKKYLDEVDQRAPETIHREDPEQKKEEEKK